MTPRTTVLLIIIVGLSLAGLLSGYSLISPSDETPSDKKIIADQSSANSSTIKTASIPENPPFPQEPAKISDIEVTGLYIDDDGSGIREIRGSFRNNGTTIIHGFDIRFNLFSENGSNIGEGSMLGWDLAPNETRELHIIIMNEEMKTYNFSGAYTV